MVSFTLSLCGKDVECSESTSVADDDITDPDIAGIGASKTSPLNAFLGSDLN